MKHVRICKYDLDSPSVEDEWTTLSELLEKTGEAAPSAAYLHLEQEFLDVVVRFLRAYDYLPLEYRFCYLTEDELLEGDPPPWLADLMLPLSQGVSLVERGRFDTLSFVERLAVFQLAIRGAVQVAIQSPEGQAVLSTMDEGFYWFATVPDDHDAEALAQSPRLFVYESIDIFDYE